MGVKSFLSFLGRAYAILFSFWGDLSPYRTQFTNIISEIMKEILHVYITILTLVFFPFEKKKVKCYVRVENMRHCDSGNDSYKNLKFTRVSRKQVISIWISYIICVFGIAIYFFCFVLFFCLFFVLYCESIVVMNYKYYSGFLVILVQPVKYFMRELNNVYQLILKALTLILTCHTKQ